MKLTNTKIKKLIRESLQRLLFESEERIENLKGWINEVMIKYPPIKA